MTLNITAERRVDLSDFGKGWDNCFLMVKSMNPKELKEWQDAEPEGDTMDEMYGNLLRRLMTGGSIINTTEDGKQEPYTIQPEDINDVVTAIGTSFKQRALMVSAGTYGLKGV